MWRIPQATRGVVALVLCSISPPCFSDEGTDRSAAAERDPVRVGIIGIDTIHSADFTRILNDPDAPKDLQGCRVVAVYPQNSPDIADSLRIAKEERKRIESMAVEIVPTVIALLQRVDVVLLETNDGRMHFEQVLPVLKAGKPVFVDKPMAASLVDVLAIFEAAKRFETPVFSSSALRYTDSTIRIGSGEIGQIVGCDTYSPCPLEKTHPDLFWYGIHGVESLFTLMGSGCESVVRTSSNNSDVVVGKWKDGRIGTFRGRRKDNNGYLGGYGGIAFGSRRIEQIGGFNGYEQMLVEVVRFFRTGKPPVMSTETIEIYAFMAAADESKRLGGMPVELKTVLVKAKREVARRLELLESD